MNINLKKALYESIMKSVSKVVKKHLNEAHVHYEKRTRPVMTEWGDYTNDVEEYDDLVVDKINQEDWLDFLLGIDELGPDIQNLTFGGIKNMIHDDVDSHGPDYKSVTARWYNSTGISNGWKNWDTEMHIVNGCDQSFAVRLFSDIEAYRIGKMTAEEFTSLYDVYQRDWNNIHDKETLCVTEIQTGKETQVRLDFNLS